MNQFLKSFSHALQGFRSVFKSERNFRIELACAVFAFFLGIALHLNLWEMTAVIFVSGWVLSAEIVNTSVEYIVDMLKPRIHPYAKLVKDLMASAVLLSACVALLLGIMIFLPKLIALFTRVPNS